MRAIFTVRIRYTQQFVYLIFIMEWHRPPIYLGNFAYICNVKNIIAKRIRRKKSEFWCYSTFTSSCVIIAKLYFPLIMFTS